MTEQEEFEDQEAQEKRKTVIDNLVKDLQSKDDRKVISALKRVPHEGSAEMIPYLLDLVMSKPSDDVRILLEKILFSLKDTDCIPPLVDALEDPKYKDIQFIILGAFWQSGLDVHDHLALIVKAATEGDYMTAVEAYSVIENLEGYSDTQLARSIKLLDGALEQKKDSHQLLQSIRQTLVDHLIS